MAESAAATFTLSHPRPPRARAFASPWNSSWRRKRKRLRLRFTWTTGTTNQKSYLWKRFWKKSSSRSGFCPQGEHDVIHVEHGGNVKYAEEGADASRPRDQPKQLLVLQFFVRGRARGGHVSKQEVRIVRLLLKSALVTNLKVAIQMT